jgi:hypothetical protein
VHAVLSRVTAVAAAAGLSLSALVMTDAITEAPPASADPGCLSCSDVSLTPDGLLARARSQMAELNSVANNPPPCNDEYADATFPEDGNDTVEYEGYIRWRLTLNEQHVWDDDATTTGYRLECWLPERPDLDGLIDVQIFDAIAPQVIAQVAIDDALSQIPALSISTNPEDDSLVAIDTWFWVDGVPPQGVSASASVPGIAVVATASPGAVRIDFGDGTSAECTGAGVEYTAGASSDCTHEYQVAGEYTITATVLWTGSYTVNGQGPFPITTAVPRTDSFPLGVNEAQAINTGSG